MFAASLIVFRETLEAALFVGIIAAATKQLPQRGRWLAGGVAAGVAGALLLALSAEQVSAWADGIGQDLVNIGILTIALSMLVWHCVWVSTHGRQMAMEAGQLGASVQGGQRKPWVLFVAVALAVLREGAETVLFVAGSLTGGGQVGTASVLLACALGLVAGAVVGIGLYAGLSRIPTQKLFAATNVLIALLAASIASQLARALAQAGLVERGTAPLWDSSAWLASDSALGVLLHALVGYDARPSAMQLGFYATVLASIYIGTRLVMRQLGVTAPHRRAGPA
ncbi:MAG: iron permease [Betaproteobacteria bacterium]|nr:iron permease [Betaproteobacteria bacterium]